ncbi:MAG: hypothetical protein L6U16_13105 [Porphyromonadaceae bacterium]|nr:MAG: hypothetical protein L6U16_13105 [Porphyromonadaceae bacterium]
MEKQFYQRIGNMPKRMSLRYGVTVLRNLIRFFYQEIKLLPGVFRRETASGFYPFGDATDFVRGRR